jgi:putative FmdB family regulatory protein
MPLYEYECNACAHRFEVIQKYSDPPIEVCPKCGSAVSKLFSSPAIQFKGSGFYLTDYGRGGKSDIGAESAKAAKESSGSSGETKAAETKTETKTETKAEPKPAAKPTTP